MTREFRKFQRLPLRLLLVAALALALVPGRASATTCLGCISKGCSRTGGSCSCLEGACLIAVRDQCLDLGFCTTVVLQGGFDETAQLSPDGRQITIGGPLECSAGERIQLIRVTITQNGSIAEGETVGGVCAGSGDELGVTVRAQGRAGFATGEAKACGLAALGDAGDTLATFQWCRDITLVVE